MNETNQRIKTNDVSYAKLLKNFVHYTFTEEEAQKHWKNIIERSNEFTRRMNRTVSISAVIADYFTSALPVFTDPFIIEENVFRNTEKMALVDSLTGLFNRRYMELALSKELMRCRRYSFSFSICMIDIDNFKKINDTRGHQFGDIVLQNIATQLKNNVREEDVICRYGGEEFLIILPQTEKNGAKDFAERLRKKIAQTEFFKSEKITYSTGIGCFHLCQGDTYELIINRADKALYQAKYNGKNKVCVEMEEDEPINNL
ncbi:MAG: hypothetical protein BKP49_03365 [Treponema sp. CETP13]|nr:MAG: hypothetical protein BKP49_03365 [Treponema sp. CETP13]